MINYKHLHYFWVVARKGGIARASEHLHLTPQTISGQLRVLEDNLGETLFKRVGRNLELSDSGRVVLSYADEIFSLGGELEEVVRNLADGRTLVLKVGIADVVPKSIAYRILKPALDLPDPLRLVCRENSLEALLGELALHRIDLVLADRPIPSSVNVRGYNHKLGSSGISFFATETLAQGLVDPFPQCLQAAPLLMPSDTNIVQGRLKDWFNKNRVRPRIVGEFDDSALMKAFGHGGSGIFIAPSSIAKEVESQFNVTVIGQTEEVREEFYVISIERKISHPAVSLIADRAREWLFMKTGKSES